MNSPDPADITPDASSALAPAPLDVVIVGAGAAGLMTGIWALRTNPNRRVFILDGAKILGAKILVAGGGRCNVTHHQVDESAFAGSSRNAIKKILRRFDVPATIAFFAELGVTLKQEDTGKLFPTTDDAHSVLLALLSAFNSLGGVILHPWRVKTITRESNHFLISSTTESLTASSLVLATGGKSLPKTGSDGHGYALARALGHTTTPRTLPALVPLTLPADHFLCQLSGISANATLELRSHTGKKLVAFTNSTLCTHFGLSGPSVLDISRYFLAARAEAADDRIPPPTLHINWLPEFTAESLDARLATLGRITPLRFLRDLLSDRLARALVDHAQISEIASASNLRREDRRRLAQTVTALPLPITGDRGFTHAEVTAGGVPLSELHLNSMHSRLCPNLFIVGELCDVDGRIGGFNFQWAWSSGFTAGVSL